jgi:hypothetical protein
MSVNRDITSLSIKLYHIIRVFTSDKGDFLMKFKSFFDDRQKIITKEKYNDSDIKMRKAEI